MFIFCFSIKDGSWLHQTFCFTHSPINNVTEKYYRSLGPLVSSNLAFIWLPPVNVLITHLPTVPSQYPHSQVWSVLDIYWTDWPRKQGWVWGFHWQRQLEWQTADSRVCQPAAAWHLPSSCRLSPEQHTHTHTWVRGPVQLLACVGDAQLWALTVRVLTLIPAMLMSMRGLSSSVPFGEIWFRRWK